MIELDGVTKYFDGLPAVSDFSWTIRTGDFCVLIGPSGCGKSTVLRMINAMILADAGTIKIHGKMIAEMPPEKLRRGIGYVIQSVGLFPHWTIAENILAVPRLLKWNAANCAARLDEITALLQIDRALLARFPRQLSGGQQQRVGVARALAADPDIILMDEPFAALDPVSRANLQTELSRIHAHSGKTIIFVTHDMDEALKLATRMAVMNKGKLVETGTPAEILNAPENDFTRGFLGGDALEMRLLDVVPVGARFTRTKTEASKTIGIDASLKEALNLMLAHRCISLGVRDANGRPIGEIHIENIIKGA
ncbi:MAG TPA: ABC transporter ATP-binding protein [Beijerinckia sp.]|nr:ABC transporter ATP-binding protein [Beijerinckia sp.]